MTFIQFHLILNCAFGNNNNIMGINQLVYLLIFGFTDLWTMFVGSQLRPSLVLSPASKQEIGVTTLIRAIAFPYRASTTDDDFFSILRDCVGKNFTLKQVSYRVMVKLFLFLFCVGVLGVA